MSLHRREIDAETDDELQFHLERQIETNIGHGMSAAEARRLALRDLGGLTQTRQAVREVRTTGLDSVWYDIRHAVRSLRRSPVFTAVALLSLALGIGANTAMFSIVNSLLLRTLPVEQPDRLVLLLSNPSVNPSSPWSNPVWEQIRDRHPDLFQTTFAFSRRTTRFNLALGGRTDFVDGVYASGQYFDALRVRPMLGRSFTAEDDRRGGGPNGPVAVISHAFWQRRFSGSAAVIGKTQSIDRVPFTIVGVMPPDFFGTDVGSRST